MSTLYIHQPGIARLRKWGVLDTLIASGCSRIDTVCYQVEDVVLRGPVAPLGDITSTYAPRRKILDQVLLDAALAAGAEFAQEHSLVGLVSDDGRVTGVRLRARAGKESTEHARLVVGADGMRSRVAELAGAATVIEDPRLSCVYYTGWTGLSCGLGMWERPGISIGTVPTHEDTTLVLTYFPQERFHTVRTDPLRAHLEAVRQVAPDLSEQLAGARQVLRLQGSGDQRNFFRTACGPGWALVGDAGHHMDSISARGITNAFMQAEVLSEELSGDLGDSVRVDAALSRFAGRRHDALIDGYQATLETARLRVQASRLRMLRSVARLPAARERYFALVAGIISMDEFLTPELALSLYR